MAKLFADSCTIAITSFISPYRADRDLARKLHGETAQGSVDEAIPFLEVWVDCPVEECEKRDPKGLYQKARKGEIKDFTGISAPYEEPLKPELHIRSDKETTEESVERIMKLLVDGGYIPSTGKATTSS